MITYSYKGFQNKKIVVGAVAAPTLKDFFQKLEDKKVRLIWFYPKLRLPLRPLSFQESIAFCTHVEYLLKAHLSLRTALQVLGHHASRSLHRLSHTLLQKIEGGFSLSDALASEGSAFDPIFINLIKVGEVNGQLESSFGQIKTDLLWKHKFQKTLTQSIRYPLILFGLVILLMMTLTSFLVPSLRSFLVTSNIEQSVATWTLLKVTDACQMHGELFLLGTFCMGAGLLIATRFEKIKFFWHKILIQLPGVGPFLVKLWLIKVSMTMAILLNSDIFLMEALTIVTSQTQNLYLKSALEKAQLSLAKGQSLSDALRSVKIMPPLVHHFIEAGERSNNLSDSFVTLRDYYNDVVQQQIEFLKDFLPTLCLLLSGGFLIWIVLALFYPLYNLSGL